MKQTPKETVVEPSNAFSILLNTHRKGIAGGSVKFKLLFTNLQDAKDQEFERIVQEIEETATVSIYRGRLALPW